MKKIIIPGILLFFIKSYSQVGIDTTNPDPSSTLHVAVNPAKVRGTLLSPMTTIQRNSIVNPASGLLVYDTTVKCLMANNGTPQVPVWSCTNNINIVNEGAFRHFFYKFNYNAMQVAGLAYATRGTKPSGTSSNNVVGYLTNNDPVKLVKVPVIDGIRMNIVFASKGPAGSTISPIIENISGGTITDFVLYNVSTYGGAPKRIPYGNFNNNEYINIDPDGIAWYDTTGFETCNAYFTRNGKMYRCTWWGYYGDGTHSVHMTMEVFD